MKVKILFLFILSISCQFIYAQAVEYTYDAAGNRILRELWSSSGPPSNKMDANSNHATIQHDLTDGLENQDIKIFPNPTDANTTIKLEGEAISTEEQSLLVFTARGELAIKQEILPNQERVEVKLENFPSGLYFIRLENDRNLYRKSLIKN